MIGISKTKGNKNIQQLETEKKDNTVNSLTRGALNECNLGFINCWVQRYSS